LPKAVAKTEFAHAGAEERPGGTGKTDGLPMVDRSFKPAADMPRLREEDQDEKATAFDLWDRPLRCHHGIRE
jgi:hypothetical protein